MMETMTFDSLNRFFTNQVFSRRLGRGAEDLAPSGLTEPSRPETGPGDRRVHRHPAGGGASRPLAGALGLNYPAASPLF